MSTVRNHLANAVDDLFADWQQSTPSDEVCVKRITIHTRPRNIASWLACQPHPEKLYWRARDGADEVAGVGIADRISSRDVNTAYTTILSHVRQVTAQHGRQWRYFGGFSFANRPTVDARWASFGHATFATPRLELHSIDTTTVAVTCNIVFRPNEQSLDDVHADIVKDIAQLVEDELPLSAPALPPMCRHSHPPREYWQNSVSQALDRIEAGVVKKVVLARQVELELEAPINAVGLLQQLHPLVRNSFVFLFQPDADHAFLSISPERLFHREHRHIRTEAIAGTRPRGDTHEHDRNLGTDLLVSEKDRREHKSVADWLLSALASLGCRLTASDEPSLLELPHLLHISQQFSGTLADTTTDADLLEALHPTSAVGGDPRDAALEQIAASEPFSRGWYAGPSGWLGTDSAEFIVAIRSALIEQSRLTVCAGAGIVAGSDPAGEWEETENKIQWLMQLWNQTQQP